MNTSLKHDVSHLPKAKRSFRKMIKGLQENTKTTNDYIKELNQKFQTILAEE